MMQPDHPPNLTNANERTGEPANHEGEPAVQLVEHFFRHESGRLVAVLARVFGVRNFELVEDMVQASLMEALQAWRIKGPPENPSAWLHQVARRKVIDAMRQRETLVRVAPAWARLHPATTDPEFDDLFLDSEIKDSQLRLIFACCHPALTRENQVALTLRSLCGFSNLEIARGLLVTEETIKKRIQRARRQLAESQVELAIPRADELAERLDSVHQCLYLLFNEGYLSTAGDAAVRVDLCEEAARLCHLLCEQFGGQSPATFALLALMLFHAARFESRTDSEGRIMLLEDQDRSKWDQDLIRQARWFLDRSAVGRSVSTFHLEAGIAMFHCAAVTFAETNWAEILRLYDALITVRASPLYHLNRAIVLAHLSGPSEGIRAIDAIMGMPELRGYHLVDVALGELHRRAGDLAVARVHYLKAREATQLGSERELIDRRLAVCHEPPHCPLSRPGEPSEEI